MQLLPLLPPNPRACIRTCSRRGLLTSRGGRHCRMSLLHEGALLRRSSITSQLAGALRRVALEGHTDLRAAAARSGTDEMDL